MMRTSLRAPEQGFTLLEIMVVVVIIGLLATIVVPNFVGKINKAAMSRAKQDIRGIETALNLYRLDNFRYPSTSDGLQALVTNPGEATRRTGRRSQETAHGPLEPSLPVRVSRSTRRVRRLLVWR